MKQRNFLRLRHAKAHDDGVLKNPLFFRARPKRWVPIAVGVAVLGAMIGAGIWLTHIPALQVNSISIQGATTLDTQAMTSQLWDTLHEKNRPFFGENSMYTVHLADLEQSVRDHFAVESAQIERSHGALVVTVVERVTTIALRMKERTVMLDLTGAYVRDATAEESRAIDVRIGMAAANANEVITPLQTDMPIVLDTQNDAVTALSPAATQSILEISQHIATAGFHPVTYTLDGLAAPFVRVNTDAPYDIYFDLFARSIEEQIRALVAIVTQSGFAAPTEYIDLRFGAYVYMK